MKKYTIYVLQDPITNEIRYVGCTKSRLSRRLYQHLTEYANKKPKTPTLKQSWIMDLSLKYKKPICIPIHDNVSEEEVYGLEEYYIHKYKSVGCDLLNALESHSENPMKNPLIASKLRGSGNGNYGKKGYANHRSKPVIVYSLNGEMIEEVGSMRQAAQKYESEFSSVVKCCKGQLNRCGNYIFKYKLL